MSEKKKISALGIFVWILAILFFFYEFFLRVLQASMASEIIQGLDITLEQFAIVGSAYYITYSLMQIPAGILLDNFSIKILVTVAASLCAFGTLWFGFSHSFASAFISRLLIGFGSAFGFVGLMIVTLNWFPKKYFPFLIGCGQFLGSIGPLCAGAPIVLVLKAVNGNWRLIYQFVALFGITLAVFLFLFLKGKPSSSDKIIFIDRKDSMLRRIKSLLGRAQIWMILCYAGTVYVALPLLGAFWGNSYLQTRGLSQTNSAAIISMVWVGLAVGSPLFGRFSDMIKRRKLILALCAALGIFSSCLLLYTPSVNTPYLLILFFLIGIGGSGQNLSFGVIAEHAPKSLRATALGVNNTAIMGFAALLPIFVTSVIRNYTVDGKLTELAFERGFLVIPICFSIAFLISIFGIRETFCRQQNVVHKVQKTG